jgi:hypothetical protein
VINNLQFRIRILPGGFKFFLRNGGSLSLLHAFAMKLLEMSKQEALLAN